MGTPDCDPRDLSAMIISRVLTWAFCRYVGVAKRLRSGSVDMDWEDVKIGVPFELVPKAFIGMRVGLFRGL